MRRVGIIVGAGACLALAMVLAALGIGDAPSRLSNWQALALGAVQGFTELLPVSSSGHLILVPWLFDWTYLEQHPDFNKTFDVALHLGTLVAVVVYFRRDIVRLTIAFVRSVAARRVRRNDERVAWFVAIATIPAVIAGAAGEGFVERRLGEPWQIALFLALGALILYLVDRLPAQRRMEDLTYRGAIGIGLAQTLALAPGISRSGIVISAGRLLRLDRNAAARFSFLLLVPVVFGAAAFRGVKDVAVTGLPPGSAGPFVVGTLAAAATGLVAIWGLLGFVRRHTYSVFVIYRLMLAAFVIALIAAGFRDSTF